MKSMIAKEKIELIKEFNSEDQVLSLFEKFKALKVKAGNQERQVYSVSSIENKNPDTDVMALVHTAYTKALRNQRIQKDMEKFKTLDVGSGVHELLPDGTKLSYTVVEVSGNKNKFWIQRDIVMEVEDQKDSFFFDFDPEGEIRIIRPTIHGYMQEKDNDVSQFYVGRDEFHPEPEDAVEEVDEVEDEVEDTEDE